MPNLIEIYNPIKADKDKAYFSLTDWNIKRSDNGSGKIRVKVHSGNKVLGEGIIDTKNWKKTCWEKVKKIEKRPEEPITYYFNEMRFEEKEKLEKDEAREYGLI